MSIVQGGKGRLSEASRLKLLKRAAGSTIVVRVGPVASGQQQAGTVWVAADNPHLSALLDAGHVTVSQAVVRATPLGLQHLKRAMSAGDPFQDQHRVLQRKTVDGDTPGDPSRCREMLTVNAAESPLTWLRTRRDRNGQPFLDDAQFLAGERLRRDYDRGNLAQRITASWGDGGGRRQGRRYGGRGGGEADLSDGAMDARGRVQRALSSLDPDLAAVARDVCCELRGIEETEKRHGWPQRSGRVILQIALNGLARHYGYRTSTARNGSAPDLSYANPVTVGLHADA